MDFLSGSFFDHFARCHPRSDPTQKIPRWSFLDSILRIKREFCFFSNEQNRVKRNEEFFFSTQMIPTVESINLPQKGKTRTFRARQFIMTVNEKVIEKTQNIIEYLEHYKNFNYMLIVEHIGQPNKHYHIYVQYLNVVNLSNDKLCGAHVEKSYGSPEQNITYLRCQDEKHRELGITYKTIYEKGELRKNYNGLTIADIREMNDDEIENLPYKFFNTINKIKTSSKKISIKERKKDVKVYYIQGPSGCGKSEKAYKIIEEKGYEFYDDVKYENNFWLGVRDCDVALYDDFRDSCMKACEFINFIDYNKHYMNIKGGEHINNYNLIIITSVQRLKELYSNMSDEPRKQWMRRITLIDMYGDEDLNLSEQLQ